MRKSIGIIGAGILGRLISLFFHQKDNDVHLFDQGDFLPRKGCSLTAAGMIAPFCEMEYSHPDIANLGVESFELWDQITAFLGGDINYDKKGTLVLAHPQDKKELLRLKEIINKHFPGKEIYQEVVAKDYEQVSLEDGLFFPFEGQIDPLDVFSAINRELFPKLKGLYFNTRVEEINSNKIKANNKIYSFDLVIDSRGLEAKLDDLRGVRGELLLVRAPDVKLTRPIRLMHPRYPIYIAPRKDHKFLIGATSVESTSMEPITVRSTLELLSAAFSVNPGFSEANILESRVGLRPCFSNHLPKIYLEDGLIRANGLYRHGYLISPMIAKLVVDYAVDEKIPKGYESFFKENP
jgi:glycine oxidase